MSRLWAASLLLAVSSAGAQGLDYDEDVAEAVPGKIARTGGCSHIDPLPVAPTEENMKRIFRGLTSEHPGKWRLKFQDSEEVVGEYVVKMGQGFVKAGPKVFVFAKNDANYTACILGHELGHLSNRHDKADDAMWKEGYAAYKGPAMKKAEALGCDETRVVDGKGGCTRSVEEGFKRYMNFENKAYIKLRRDQEDEADRESLSFILAGGFEPWACWLLHRKMGAFPEDPSNPRFHRSAAERARVMAEALGGVQYLQYAQPCE